MSIRPVLVDSLCLGASRRTPDPPAHASWDDPPPGTDTRPIRCGTVVGSRVWTLEGAVTFMMRVYDAAPSAALPPNPSRAVAVDCPHAVFAIHDPSVREARALSAQVRELRDRAKWLAATRAAQGLPPAQIRVVYCSRTPVRAAAPAAKASGTPAESPGSAVRFSLETGPTSALASPGAAFGGKGDFDVPAPVEKLAEELRCGVALVHLPTAQGLTQLSRQIAASDVGLTRARMSTAGDATADARGRAPGDSA